MRVRYLEAAVPAGDVEQCARYWCLAARLSLAADAITDAWRLVERARPAASALHLRSSHSFAIARPPCRAALGDIDAMRIHVSTGLAAARAAHLPLQAIKLRLTYIEGLIRAERRAQARAAARHLGHIRSGAIPPLLKARIDAVVSATRHTAVGRTSHLRAITRRRARRLNTMCQRSRGAQSDCCASAHHLEDETRGAHARSDGDSPPHARDRRRHLRLARIGAEAVCVIGSCRRRDQRGDRSTSASPFAPERAGSWIEGAVPDPVSRPHHRRRGDAVECRRTRERRARAGVRRCSRGGVRAARLRPHRAAAGAGAAEEAAFDLIGVSPAIEDVRRAIARAANAPFTVLIEGESGSGKELVARAIHRAGCRRERRFCAFNCAAMPEDLVDAELFGHAKGAFTGAAGERVGLFESADGGTVFLDEVGELSARAQAKMLRVLQEGEIRRIGENFTRPFDARLVAATNRVTARRGRRRALPSGSAVSPRRHSHQRAAASRARRGHSAARRALLAAVGRAHRQQSGARARRAVGALARYDWPGNVRELQNVLTALVVAVPPRGVVGASELPAAIARAAQTDVARIAGERTAQIRGAVRARRACARGRPSRADGRSAWLEPTGACEIDAAPSSRCLDTSSAGCC